MSDNPTVWIYDLPEYDSRFEGNIILRESDGTIVYWNNNNIYLIRDDTTHAIIYNSITVPGAGEIKTTISGEFNPAYSYLRTRTVTGSDLNQSSSSSSKEISRPHSRP